MSSLHEITDTGVKPAAWAEINVGAIAHNVRALRGVLRPGTEVMAVAKAGGYGMGACEFARAALAGGATQLAVASIEEAAAIRNKNIDAPILILYPSLPEWISDGIDNNVTFSVSSLDEIHAISDVARSRGVNERVKIHLSVDTGMGREGLLPDETARAAEVALSEHILDLEGIFTHFSGAEEREDDATREQIATFNRVLTTCSDRGINFRLRHAANSAGAALFPQSHYNLVRCGLLLHGVRGWNSDRDRLDLRPSLSLKARITSVFRRPKGWPVGYNRTHVCDGDSLLARIPFGYSEGYRRALSGRCNVLIRGRRVPVVGTISMNCILADVSGLERSDTGAPIAGEEAVLIGESGKCRVTAEEVASRSGTIPYVLMTHINSSVRRSYTGWEEMADLRRLPPPIPVPAALLNNTRESRRSDRLANPTLKRPQRRRSGGADLEGASILRELEGPTLFDFMEEQAGNEVQTARKQA